MASWDALRKCDHVVAWAFCSLFATGIIMDCRAGKERQWSVQVAMPADCRKSFLPFFYVGVIIPASALWNAVLVAWAWALAGCEFTAHGTRAVGKYYAHIHRRGRGVQGGILLGGGKTWFYPSKFDSKSKSKNVECKLSRVTLETRKDRRFRSSSTCLWLCTIFISLTNCGCFGKCQEGFQLKGSGVSSDHFERRRENSSTAPTAPISPPLVVWCWRCHASAVRPRLCLPKY